MSTRCFFAAAALSVAMSAHAELVVNGGFEAGSFAGWTTTAAGSGSNFSIVNSPAHTGAKSALFAANQGQHDQIFQTIGTSFGNQYHCSLWIWNGGVGDDCLQVLWEGNIKLNLTPVSTGLESWEMVEFNATASQNGSELRIKGFDNAAFFHIDDVSVNVVPEPSVVGLAAIGLLAFRARRRK